MGSVGMGTAIEGSCIARVSFGDSLLEAGINLAYD
jgi:hypothetical protein